MCVRESKLEGLRGLGLRVCVSMWMCSFGSWEINCIHLHLLAGVCCVTCWNSNALLPPETQTTDVILKTEADIPLISYLIFFLLSLSLSLCSDSVFCLAPSLTVPHVQMPGWVSLWHLTNSITICSFCPLHFEWWYSHQRSLFIEQLSEVHTYTCRICNHSCTSFLFLCKNEPLVTLN